MILIVNLMPDKNETKENFKKILGDVDIDFLKMKTHTVKCSTEDDLKGYLTLDEIKDKKYFGAIVTGAPLEYIKFEDVDYWKELKEVIDYLDKNIKSTIYICWGAQAALYHFHGINKYILKEKLFGVYTHNVKKENPFVKENFNAPHSRNSYNKIEEIQAISSIEIIAESEKTGPYLLTEYIGQRIYITGHGEYQKDRLEREYLRDLNVGNTIDKPENYFNEDDTINFSWKNHRENFYQNWLIYILK